MTDLHAAIIGFGASGAAIHAPLIAATPGLAVGAVVTGDPARRAEAARAFPDAELPHSADELWRGWNGHDVVVIASPNAAHVAQAERALDLGAAVVVDKPVAASAAAARPLVERAAAAGALLTVFQNRRWDSDHLTVRRLLREGALGDVLRYESRFERFRPAMKPGRAWREASSADEGGGLLLDLGSHLVDQALCLFGPVAAVYAEAESRRGGASDDHDFVSLRHRSGVRSHLSMTALAGAPGPRLRILGTRGAYVCEALDGQEASLRAGPVSPEGWGSVPEAAWGVLARGRERRPVPSEPGDWPAFYAGLVTAVRDGGPPPVDPWDAVRTLEVLDAARASAEREAVVTVDP